MQLAVERHPLADDPFRACRLVHRYFLRVAFDEPAVLQGIVVPDRSHLLPFGLPDVAQPAAPDQDHESRHHSQVSFDHHQIDLQAVETERARHRRASAARSRISRCPAVKMLGLRYP